LPIAQQNDRGRGEHGVGPFQIGNGRDGQQHDGPASRRNRQSFTTDLQFVTQTSNNDEHERRIPESVFDIVNYLMKMIRF